MINFIFSSVPVVISQLWPTIIMLLFISSLMCITGRSRSERLRWVIGITIAVSGIVGFTTALHYSTNPQHNWLIRDIIAFTIFSIASPALTAITASLLVRAKTVIRFLVSAFVGLLLLLVSPLVILLVHCSSGDCL
jgi:hypothetical protein